MQSDGMLSRKTRVFVFALGALFGLSLLRFAFEPRQAHVAELVAHERRVLGDEAERRRDNEKMRRINPEWDLMRRMYLALSFADLAIAEPSAPVRDGYIGTLDLIVDDLLQTVRTDDPYVFLLPYGRLAPWRAGGRSLFVDGEVAVVLEARLLVGPRPDLEAPLALRIQAIERAMSESPTVSGESYPDEAWTFCNTTALAALRMHDARMGTDHGPLARRWIAFAKAHLVDPKTGMLVSRYRYEGRIDEGPEGSSVFMAAHNLLLWDEAFARDQYARARESLTFSVLGFGLAREWPRKEGGGADVDSGPVVPLLGASPGASGMALLGASAFGDVALQRDLMRSLNLAAIPKEPHTGERMYAAAGPMGNAVVIHALTMGALFRKVLDSTHPERNVL